MATGEDKPPPIVYIRPPTENDALLLKLDSNGEYSEGGEPNAPPEDDDEEETVDDIVIENTDAKRMAIISLVVMLVLVFVSVVIFLDNRPLPSSGVEHSKSPKKHKFSTNYVKKHHKDLVPTGKKKKGKKGKKGKKHKQKNYDQEQMDNIPSNETIQPESLSTLQTNKLLEEIGVPHLPDIDSQEDNDGPRVVENNEGASKKKAGKKRKTKYDHSTEVIISNSSTIAEEPMGTSNQVDWGVVETPVIDIKSSEDIPTVEYKRDAFKGKWLRRQI